MKERLITGIDVGNSTVRVALLREDGVDCVLTVPARPWEGLCERLVHGASSLSEAMCRAEPVLVSSVCPSADGAIRRFAGEFLQAGKPVFISRSDVPLAVGGAVKHPEKVGIDRLLCGYAALQLYGHPCIVIGVGTAVTVDLIGDSGAFEGGAIAPGPGISSLALSQWTCGVPQVKPAAPAAACGHNTEEAVRSGIYHFCRGGVTALAGALSRSCKGSVRLVVTGGNMDILKPLDFYGECFTDRALLLKALWQVYKASVSF